MSIEITRVNEPVYRGPLGTLARPEPQLQSEFRLPTSFRDLVLILFKWKWSIFFILVTGFIGSIVWLWVIRDEAYEVSSKILVKIGHEQTSNLTSMNEHPIPVVGERTHDVNSEIDILQNKELMGQVVDALHLDVPSPPPPYPAGTLPRIRWHVKDTMSRLREWQNELFIGIGLRPRLTYRERVLSMLSDGVIVTPQKDSNVIVARMFIGVREGGSVILNTLVDLYLKHRLQVWKGQGTEAFFAANLERSVRDLRQAEAALRNFEQTHNIIALQKQQEVLLVAIAGEEERTRQAGIVMEEARAKLTRVTAELSKPEPDFAALGEFPQGSFSDAVMQQLSGIIRQREQLRMTEFETGVRLENLRKQFRLLLDDVVSNVRAAAAERTAAYETRVRALTGMRAELTQLHGTELGWTDLQRRVTMAEAAYAKYSAKAQETAGLAELETRHIGNVVVIEHATDPLRPAGTRKLTLLATALAVVFLAALAWVAVAEFFDHRIYSTELLEGLVGVPAIGAIPASRAARVRNTLQPDVPQLQS
jgi:succinoglycan biosynthesis transport protein ExoP